MAGRQYDNGFINEKAGNVFTFPASVVPRNLAELEHDQTDWVGSTSLHHEGAFDQLLLRIQLHLLTSAFAREFFTFVLEDISLLVAWPYEAFLADHAVHFQPLLGRVPAGNDWNSGSVVLDPLFVVLVPVVVLPFAVLDPVQVHDPFR